MSTDTKIAPFEATPLDSIPSTVKRVQTTFRSQRTKPIEYRLVQLRKLYWGLVDYSDEIVEACKLDLGKSAFEVYLTELDWCKNDIIFITQNLAKWMKDEKAPDIPLTNMALSPKIRKDPLGSVLIIGAYNFPIQLSLGPFIGAIAAGCTAVLKPSEVSPHSATVMKKIIEERLDTDAYACVNGGVPETTTLLNEKWDKIFYTGNATVGTIIAKKAAETLTPVCLELGGRNPAIVTKNADARLAARRLLWGKFLNAGQVCISQNYMMVDREIFPQFIEELKIAMKEFYPNGAKASPDYGRIVNARHFHRIKKMLDETDGKILIGGEMDEAENFIEPTVVEVSSTKDSMIVDESFGPLMPIMKIDNLDEAIRIANEVHSTPLGLYPFGNKSETDRMLNEIISGGASVNDAYFHGSIPTLSFGGVGDSGQGAYRGKASFDTFTHCRSVTTTPGWIEKLIAIRYPPYAGKIVQFKRINDMKPNFDREGKVKSNLKMTVLTKFDGLELPATFDAHVHLRDGAMMETVVPTIRRGGADTCFVMPNLVPPITTVEMAQAYKARLQAIDSSINYLMSLYLHPSITPETVRAAAKAGIAGIKSYPAGVTTNSSSGVLSYEAFYPVFAVMEEVGMVLNLHGECPSDHAKNITVLNAEPSFLPTLKSLHAKFPKLKIVLEHCSTAAGIAAVKECGPNVVGTITAHHLWITIDDWADDAFNYCKPVAKLPSDRTALLKAAVESNGKFFLGTDSAPHDVSAKKSGTGKTAAGVFTQPYATQLVFGALEVAVEKGVLSEGEISEDALKGFLSGYGRKFYGIGESGDKTVVKKGDEVTLDMVKGEGVAVVPFRRGQSSWSLEWK